eukprot:SAG31_NODE_13344_length_875_cov_4.476804_1_plen_73_part_10
MPLTRGAERLKQVTSMVSHISSPATCQPCAGALPMPSDDEIATQMRRCIEVSRQAGERGDGPYGCTLVDRDGN